MSGIPPFRFPGRLQDIASDLQRKAEEAAAKARAEAEAAAAAVRRGMPAVRPSAPAADLSSDFVAKLPPCMRDFVNRLPNVGAIGGAVGAGKPAVIQSREFGASSATPAVLEVPVGGRQEGMLAVGKKAHEKFFPGDPPFKFNVNFSCAEADMLTRHSEYADPRSPWFNVFFGRYQIDCPAGARGEKDKWDRPFGFVRAGSNEINFDDILKIGNADWGYFSNWMYGVPEKDLDRIFASQKDFPPPKCRVTNPSVRIGGKEYVECEMDGARFPSAYVSGRDGKSLVNNDPMMSKVWRDVFGKQRDSVAADPAVAKAHPESFFPTEMKMKFYLRQEKRWDAETKSYVYSTEIYGGGVNKTWAGDDPARRAHNERFLDAQMAAVRETMPGG